MQPKYAFVIIAILLISLTPVVSADLLGDIVSGLSKMLPSATPEINKAEVIQDTQPLVVSASEPMKTKIPKPLSNYEYRGTGTASIIQQVLGIYPENGDVAVIINGRQVAVIPPYTRFANIKIHEECLPYQYGTDKWYDCEVPYQ